MSIRLEGAPAPDGGLRFLEAVNVLRAQATRKLDPGKRASLGQFLTPSPVARLMASMFDAVAERVALLDAGAGSGSLAAAAVLELVNRQRPPREIAVTAYEIDDALLDSLQRTMSLCQTAAAEAGVIFHADVVHDDFIRSGVRALRGGLFAESPAKFTHAILNPPYAKIAGDSQMRRLLRAIGVETGNLYAAFLAVAVELLEPDGELVAITPRSFCNGPYFRSFRRWFLREMSPRRIHVFNSRSAAFRSDEVLQENVIFHTVKTHQKPAAIVISTSEGNEDHASTTHVLDYQAVVRPDDRDSFIHIVPDEWGTEITQQMSSFRTTLKELGIGVSNRARRGLPGEGVAPPDADARNGAAHLPNPLRSRVHPLAEA